MRVVLICLSGLLLLAGMMVLLLPDRTWALKRFLDNYAPDHMPETWTWQNRGLGIGLISAGLLIILLSVSLL